MGFALAVTHPQAGNLGGGGFMLIHLAKENKTIALDLEKLPLLSHNHVSKPDQSVDHKKARFSLQPVVYQAASMGY